MVSSCLHIQLQDQSFYIYLHFFKDIKKDHLNFTLKIHTSVHIFRETKKPSQQLPQHSDFAELTAHVLSYTALVYPY